MVKVSPKCGFCLINRAIAEIENVVSDEDQKFEILQKIFAYFSENFYEDSVPSDLGTIRDRIIRTITKKDPYKLEKRKSNELALKFLPKIEKELNEIEDEWTRFRKALLYAIVGNIIEFDIDENKDPLENLRKAVELAEKDLVIDQSIEVYKLVKNSKTIVYLVDNAGEIVFDKILINELRKICEKIIVIVKEVPVLNDATMEDAEFISLTTSFENVKVIPSGTDHVGIILDETPPQILRILNSCDLIIAKGMGYFETLTEYDLQKNIVHLFRTKCKNVADILKIDIQKNVILLRK
ncbi:MAG: damage-control phosphatase ARMT1 family protein [Candidatus Helarchaeota archaeon]